jgi:hypothetical protein
VILRDVLAQTHVAQREHFGHQAAEAKHLSRGRAGQGKPDSGRKRN